jgi:AcrR family transcriptional regulator
MNESAHAKARRHLDPVGTRKAILNAAVTEFAQRGYSGTAMGDVADAAGVTKSLVQYHFETKEQLWLTAVASCMQPFIDAVDRFLASEHTVEDAACLLRERFELFQRRPEVVRFLGWMSLEPYPLPPAGVERAPKAWAAIVASMTHAEHRRMILALSALDGWMLTREFKSKILGQDLSRPETNAAVLREIESTLLGRRNADETKS